MKESEKLWIAKMAIEKNMDYETLKYSDYLYGREDEVDDVYDLVEEYHEIGINAWNIKYGGII